MFQADINDLRCEIYDIKKQNSEVRSENQLLKVRVRKLTDEVNKKSRQIANLLDPKKAESIRSLLSQHGVSFIMALREENSKLLRELSEKDNLIRKLHNELRVFKLYSEKTKLNILSEKSPTMTKINTPSEVNSYTTVSTSRTARSRAKSVNTGLRNSSPSPQNKQSAQSRQSLSTSEFKQITDLEKSYLILLNNNLKTIKECGIKNAKPQQENIFPLINCTQLTSPNELPHMEIQQLQSYFMNVLGELDYLKEKMVELQAEQAMKTEQSKNQGNNIQKLSTEIQSINLNGSEKLAENKDSNQRDAKTEDSTSCNIESQNLTEIETESNASLFNEGSLLSSAAIIPENTPMCPEKKSVSVQTTKHFCATPVFTHKDNCKVNKINSSLKYENGIEVQYIN